MALTTACVLRPRLRGSPRLPMLSCHGLPKSLANGLLAMPPLEMDTMLMRLRNLEMHALVVRGGGGGQGGLAS